MTASPTIAAATAQTRDGATIVYDIWGETTANRRIVLVHSLGMDRTFWHAIAPRLPPDTATLIHDCRGHGQSSKPAGPYTAEQFADDVADLLTVVGWDKTAIAGASMGGCVALAFAIRHADRTTGLGLIDTTAWYGEDAAKAWDERAKAAAANGLSSLIDFQLTRWFGDAFRAENPQVIARATEVFMHNDVAAYGESCRLLGSVDLRAGLGGLSIPTRIVVGEEDYATPPAMAQTLHDGIAGAHLSIIPKARHLTPLEQPDIITAELTALLG